MTEFAVRGEYITLGQLLKAEGIAGGGGDIKHFLAEGGILVNDEPENRRGKKLRPGDRVLLPDGEVRLMVAEVGGRAEQEKPSPVAKRSV